MAMDQQDNLDFEQQWNFLQEGIAKFIKYLEEGLDVQGFSSEDHMMLYTAAYDMCIRKRPHDCSQRLYDKHQEYVADYVMTTVLPSLSLENNEFMTREFVRRWKIHKMMVQFLSRIFGYLDRYFRARKSLPSLKEDSLTCFRDLVYQEVKGRVRDFAISLIDREREGEQIDQTLLKNLVDIFIENGMDYYENDFEAYMLKGTVSYYSQRTSNWILNDSFPDYVLKAKESLKREKDIAAHYLHSSSETKLFEIVQHELLVVHVDQLTEKGCLAFHALIRDEKVEELSSIFGVFSLTSESLQTLANIFNRHIIAEGIALVKQVEDVACNSKANTKDVGSLGQVFVKNLLELHEKFMAYVTGCFHSHVLFLEALEMAFHIFCSKGAAGNSGIELFAAFYDNILKRGGCERMSDEATETTLEKVVRLLACLSNANLFAELYRKTLARRLLFDQSANVDHEICSLKILKKQFGGQLTSRMEGMVTDQTSSTKIQSNFEEYLCHNPTANPGTDFTVTVLSTGFWPRYKPFNLNLPVEMVKCTEVFKDFYGSKTKHRKLTWIHSLGMCNIIGIFEAKTIELMLTTPQAATLMLFNASERLSYQEIVAQLNISDDDVVRLLHSLSCAKYKILNKEPSTKTISQTDVFEFNAKFTEVDRIKIPLPPLGEKKKVIEDVGKDRQYIIEASIIRIMKRRKVLGYQQLVGECVEQLRQTFKPDAEAINKRIDDLIAREYLERDKGNPNLFKYLP